MNINNLIQNAIACSIIFIVFLIAFTWIIFDFNSSPTSLKDSLSIVASIFGGVTTLTAAYIASKLFNDWKEQQRFQNKISIINKAFEQKEQFYKLNYELQILAIKINTGSNTLHTTGENDLVTNKILKNWINEIYELSFNNVIAHTQLSLTLKRIYNHYDLNNEELIILRHNLKIKFEEFIEKFKGLDDEKDLIEIKNKAQAILHSIGPLNKILNNSITGYLDNSSDPNQKHSKEPLFKKNNA